MQSHWRKLLSLLPYRIERKLYNNYFVREDAVAQKSNGLKLPSNLAKHNVLRQLQQKYTITTLVETGTYLGDTLYVLYNDFEQLYSIELSQFYYNNAVERFNAYNRISLIHGDSGQRLKELIPLLKNSTLFWLDGHYSGGLTAKGDKECPVYEELKAIFVSPFEHFVIIDDARLFVGENDYPALQELKEFVMKHKPNYMFFVENDSIRLLPTA